MNKIFLAADFIPTYSTVKYRVVVDHKQAAYRLRDWLRAQGAKADVVLVAELRPPPQVARELARGPHLCPPRTERFGG